MIHNPWVLILGGIALGLSSPFVVPSAAELSGTQWAIWMAWGGGIMYGIGLYALFDNFGGGKRARMKRVIYSNSALPQPA